MSASNVQFSVALHLMAALANSVGQEVSSGQLAGSVNTNASFVRRSLSKLVKSGLVSATRGKNGFYSLARPGGEITLLDIYRASEAPPAFAIHEYPEEPRCPVSSGIKPCSVHILDQVQDSLERALAAQTLDQLTANIRNLAAR